MTFEDWAKNEGMFLNKNKGHYTDPETNRANYIWDACAEQSEENIKQAIESHKPRWIPVSERLPDKENMICAVISEHFECPMIRIWMKKNWFNVPARLNITHWLELPEMPE